MQRLITYVLITLLSFGLVIHEASAKRFGGGRSFGVQRSHSSLFSGYKPNATPMRKVDKTHWGSLFGGLLLGGLLSTLFMGHGLTSGLFSWILLGLAAYAIFNFIRRKNQPAASTSQKTQPFWQQTTNSNQAYQYTNGFGASATANPIHNFNQDDFLRDAKICFLRLQAAYDQKNSADIKTFTLPEIYAEIQMQFDERGNEPNHTEVMSLEAELLDVSKQSLSTIASVRFTGLIKEDSEPATALNEIWHFRQMSDNGPWLVGGIQQNVNQP